MSGGVKQNHGGSKKIIQNGFFLGIIFLETVILLEAATSPLKSVCIDDDAFNQTGWGLGRPCRSSQLNHGVAIHPVWVNSSQCVQAVKCANTKKIQNSPGKPFFLFGGLRTLERLHAKSRLVRT